MAILRPQNSGGAIDEMPPWCTSTSMFCYGLMVELNIASRRQNLWNIPNAFGCWGGGGGGGVASPRVQPCKVATLLRTYGPWGQPGHILALEETVTTASSNAVSVSRQVLSWREAGGPCWSCTELPFIRTVMHWGICSTKVGCDQFCFRSVHSAVNWVR